MGAIDMSLAANAPPKRGAKTAASGGGSTRLTVKDKRIEAVDGVFQFGQLGCMFFRQYADAGAIGMYGHQISVEVAGLAATDERIAKAVDYLMEVGPYAGLITAAMPFIVQLMVNHKMLPAGRIQGTLPPEVLNAKMEAEVLQRSAQAMREAEEARQEAALALQEAQDAASAAGSSDGMTWAANGAGQSEDASRSHP